MISKLVNSSLKLKLLMWAALSLFILAVTLIHFNTKKLETSLLETAKKSALEQSQMASRMLQNKVNESFTVARTVANTLGAAKASNGKFELTRDGVNEILKNVLKENPAVLGSWTLWEPNAFDNKDEEFVNTTGTDATGRFIPYWTRDGNGNPQVEALISYTVPGDGDYYLLAKNSEKEVVLEPYLYPVNGKQTLITTLTVPILVDGKFVGVSGVDISLDFFQKMTDNVTLFDKKGKLVIFSNKGIIAGYTGKPKLVNKGFDKVKADGYKALDKSRFTNKVSIETDGLNITTVSPVSFGKVSTPWFIETIVPLSLIREQINSEVLSVITIGSVMTLFFLGVGLWIINRICSRLSNLSDKLLRSASETEESSISIKNASANVSSATTQQASAIQETVSSLNEINAMVSKSVSNATKSTTMTDESFKVAQEGNQSVNQIVRSIEDVDQCNNKIVSQIEKSNDELNHIITVINNISEKTSVINDIVFQTRLLSFNASVEAARAGEYGKGFAVVAEEIGGLANMSGSAAQEITEMLNESIDVVKKTIQNTQSNVEKLVQESSVRVETSVGMAKDAGQTLESLVRNVSEVQKMMEEIQIASNEQLQGIDSINLAMKELNQTTITNSDSAKSTHKFSEGMTERAQGLKLIVSDLESEIFGEQNKKDVA